MELISVLNLSLLPAFSVISRYLNLLNSLNLYFLGTQPRCRQTNRAIALRYLIGRSGATSLDPSQCRKSEREVPPVARSARETAGFAMGTANVSLRSSRLPTRRCFLVNRNLGSGLVVETRTSGDEAHNAKR